MSSRRQKLLARVNWYLQSSLKHITELITGNKFYYRGGRYRQVSLYFFPLSSDIGAPFQYEDWLFGYCDLRYNNKIFVSTSYLNNWKLCIGKTAYFFPHPQPVLFTSCSQYIKTQIWLASPRRELHNYELHMGLIVTCPINLNNDKYKT